MGPEARIEKRRKANVEKVGGISYKFTSPARASVPDRLELYNVGDAALALMHLVNEQVAENAHRSAPVYDYASAVWEMQRLLALCVKFAEIKAPGEKPTPAQEREHTRLRAMGFEVLVIDSNESADAGLELAK